MLLVTCYLLLFSRFEYKCPWLRAIGLHLNDIFGTGFQSRNGVTRFGKCVYYNRLGGFNTFFAM